MFYETYQKKKQTNLVEKASIQNNFESFTKLTKKRNKSCRKSINTKQVRMIFKKMPHFRDVQNFYKIRNLQNF